MLILSCIPCLQFLHLFKIIVPFLLPMLGSPEEMLGVTSSLPAQGVCLTSVSHILWPVRVVAVVGGWHQAGFLAEDTKP